MLAAGSPPSESSRDRNPVGTHGAESILPGTLAGVPRASFTFFPRDGLARAITKGIPEACGLCFSNAFDSSYVLVGGGGGGGGGRIVLSYRTESVKQRRRFVTSFTKGLTKMTKIINFRFDT